MTKPNSRDGVTSILIPAANEYSDPNDQKNYLNIDTMWRRIDPKGGRDIQNWERITDKDFLVN